MSHRAEQIVDAAIAALQAHALLAGTTIYKHRVLSLSADEQELPAVSVTLGDDTPIDADGAANLAFFDSVQTLAFRIALRGEPDDDEAAIITQLQAKRRGIHVAIMDPTLNQQLGLAFVLGTIYGGCDAPVIDSSTELLGGMLDCRWSFFYRMNLADPE